MNGDRTLRQNYEQVLKRIRDACEAAGRPADSVRLLAVSKAFAAAHVLALAALGQRAFGENYLQEALDKIAACSDERSLEWHFIGPIQSNKTRPIAEHFDWVHSVDREKVARRLAEQRPADLPPLNLCLQVNVSGEASKSGVAPGEAVALALACAALPGVRLRGLMAIPRPLRHAQRTACARPRGPRRRGGERRPRTSGERLRYALDGNVRGPRVRGNGGCDDRPGGQRAVRRPPAPAAGGQPIDLIAADRRAL